MAATLANRGVNPLTGEQVVTPYAVARTLSVMTSSGMYDYAGEWIYRVGIPAKSGVGGGIVAALPSQFGLGTFSPLLDSHGNSVRGLKVCEASVVAVRPAHAQPHRATCAPASSPTTTSRASHRAAAGSRTNSRSWTSTTSDIRVIELVGALTFANIDYVARRLSPSTSAPHVADPRSAPRARHHRRRGAAARRQSGEPGQRGNATVVLCGIEKARRCGPRSRRCVADVPKRAPLRPARRGDRVGRGPGDLPLRRLLRQREPVPLGEQALLAGLSADEIAELRQAGASPRRFTPASASSPPASRRRRSSSCKAAWSASSCRAACGWRRSPPGMEFGEMALIEEVRSADVWADTRWHCLELPVSRFRRILRAASAQRPADHAQSGGAADQTADPGQRQGRRAERVLRSPARVASPPQAIIFRANPASVRRAARAQHGPRARLEP